MQILLRWAVSAVALYLTVVVGHLLFPSIGLYIEPGTRAIVAALITSAVLGVVNAVIRPVVQLLALPITCLTLGLFSFVINAALFWIVGQVVPGFHVRGFLAALFGSIVMGVISGLLNMFVASAVEKDRDSKA